MFFEIIILPTKYLVFLSTKNASSEYVVTIEDLASLNLLDNSEKDEGGDTVI